MRGSGPKVGVSLDGRSYVFEPACGWVGGTLSGLGEVAGLLNLRGPLKVGWRKLLTGSLGPQVPVLQLGGGHSGRGVLREVAPHTRGRARVRAVRVTSGRVRVRVVLHIPTSDVKTRIRIRNLLG